MWHVSILLCLFFMLTPVSVADVIELTNGDRITADIIEQTDDQLVIEHPVLGRLTLSMTQIVAIIPPSLEVVPEILPPIQDTGSGYSPDSIPFLVDWIRKLELGLNGTEGNSQTFNFRIGFTADKENDRDRRHIGASLYRSTSRGNTTRNDFFIEAITDVFNPDKQRFYFTQARYDYDDLQAWRHRIAAAGGVGYQLVASEALDLIGRVGGGANYLWAGEGDDELSPEMLLSLEGKWKIKADHSFEFKNTLYPSLRDTGQFRTLTTLAYLITMDYAKSMTFKLGLANEYESRTDDTSKQNDLTYYAALVFDF